MLRVPALEELQLPYNKLAYINLPAVAPKLRSFSGQTIICGSGEHALELSHCTEASGECEAASVLRDLRTGERFAG
jgi:hypothetical protein